MHSDIFSSFLGIFLQGAEFNNVLNNYIRIVLLGIFLGNGSLNNLIYANKINEVQYSGIALEGNNYANQVHGNSLIALQVVHV